jgi:hypothetical protein
MQITIEIKRSRCHSPGISRNGEKGNGAQDILYGTEYPVRYKITSAKTASASLDCGRQFVGGHNITYRGCLS